MPSPPELPQSPELLVPLVVGRPATAVYPAGARLGPRLLVDHELVLVITGSAELTLDEHRETLLPGSWVLARPGMRDSYRWDPDRLSRHLYVHFELDPRLDTSSWPRTRHWPVEAGLEAQFRYLVWLGSTADGSDRGAAPGAVARLLVAALLATFVTGAVASSNVTPRADAPVARALAHVRHRWERDGLVPLSRGELASAAGVSVPHLSRLFRQEYGLGPSGALEWVRLRRACVLLSRGSMSVREIALAVGYLDQYHFSRRFRVTFALSPTGFRAASAGVPAATPGPAGLARLEQVLSADDEASSRPVPVLDWRRATADRPRER